jgi:DNA polymerase delta subunit 1
MLIDRDVKGAEEWVIVKFRYFDVLTLMGCSYTKQTISDLLQNKVDMSQLVITKALAKTGQSEHNFSIEQYDVHVVQITPENKRMWS